MSDNLALTMKQILGPGDFWNNHLIYGKLKPIVLELYKRGAQITATSSVEAHTEIVGVNACLLGQDVEGAHPFDIDLKKQRKGDMDQVNRVADAIMHTLDNPPPRPEPENLYNIKCVL